MDIKNIIASLEQSDIDRTEQQVLVMQNEQQDSQYNMIAFAE